MRENTYQKKKNLMRENLTSWSSLWKGERKDYLWYRGEQDERQTYISTKQAVKNKHWLTQTLKQQKTWIDSHIKAEEEQKEKAHLLLYTI